MKVCTRRDALTGIGTLAGAAILSGCAVNPVTGKREFMIMGESKEIAMGQQAHPEIVKQYGRFENDEIQSWFTEKGKEMAKVTHRRDLPYSFTVLDSPVVNAFAVPGGYVYVTRGILGYFNNEAQFAGVLAHEFGHINYRHSAAKYSKAQLAGLALGVGSIFSEEFNRYAAFAQVGVSLMFLKFSRDDERQADHAGVEYSSLVGYDAVEMSVFFNTLERMRPKGGSLPSWASTHPDPGDRVKATRSQALKFQKAHTDRTYMVRRNEYLDLVDGMPFGDDPRQGYVKDNMFYHPGMRFIFPVPENWNLTNNPAEVRIAPEKQGVLIIFTAAQGETPAVASTKFVTDNKVTVETTSALEINGMNAQRTQGQVGDESATYAIVSHFIKKDDTVFSFHGLSAPTDVQQYLPLFDSTAHGFKNLDDHRMIDVSPDIIQVRTAGTQKTCREIFNDMGVPEDKVEELAIVNGFELNQVIPAGTRIKIVV